MPVIYEDHIVGHIYETGLFTSKVRLFIKPPLSVGGVVSRTGETCVITADFLLEREGLARVGYMTAGSELRVGDRVMTSGMGSIYPEGFVIGEITEVSVDPLTRSVSGYLRPAADFDAMRAVMVIVEIERTLR
jgi:rod shape-determining protein MreC